MIVPSFKVFPALAQELMLSVTAMVLKPAPHRPEDLARPNQIASLIPNRDCLDLDHHVWMHQRINPDGGEAWKFLQR
jgi:hypothetical protein